ncbi:pyridoxamine 5'-phosphate oxidase family protein [Candidatus Bathyarchaeota archaeon]|nr:pyridoxamine 5'-phosphate oxidase family protein [Candidatus Bathyarchaeota archaeon]
METYENDRRKLDYTKIVNEIQEILSKNREITLATSTNNRVTARTISFVNKEQVIYFLTWEHNKKVEQITQNPNVALSLSNIQIEGHAEVVGKPKDHQQIGDMFRSKFSPKWFDTFSQIKEMVLVKVEAKQVVKFETIDRRFYLQSVDLTKKTAHQMRIEDRTHPHFPR